MKEDKIMLACIAVIQTKEKSKTKEYKKITLAGENR